MGVDTTNWTLAQYLAAGPSAGLSPSNYVPASLQSVALSVAQNSVPPGAPKTFVLACQANLIMRGIFYFKSNPGDCGSPSSLDLENAQITGAAGNVAGSLVKAFGSQIANGIGSMAGAVLPGIGVAVQAVQAIFANHAAAVANEQATICKVSQIINQVIPYYDAQVRAGRISASDAYAGMQNFIGQVDEALAAIEKKCDAACVYTAILQAHSTFVEKYWPAIAPVTAAPHAPGAPPATTGTRPGGVIAAGNPGVAPLNPLTSAGEVVQVTNNPAVYVVDDSGILHHIPDPDTFSALGYSWGEIKQIPNLNGLSIGQPITSVDSTNPQSVATVSAGFTSNDLMMIGIVLAIVAAIYFFTKSGSASIV